MVDMGGQALVRDVVLLCATHASFARVCCSSVPLCLLAHCRSPGLWSYSRRKPDHGNGGADVHAVNEEVASVPQGSSRSAPWGLEPPAMHRLFAERLQAGRSVTEAAGVEDASNHGAAAP